MLILNLASGASKKLRIANLSSNKRKQYIIFDKDLLEFYRDLPKHPTITPFRHYHLKHLISGQNSSYTFFTSQSITSQDRFTNA